MDACYFGVLLPTCMAHCHELTLSIRSCLFVQHLIGVQFRTHLFSVSLCTIRAPDRIALTSVSDFNRYLVLCYAHVRDGYLNVLSLCHREAFYVRLLKLGLSGGFVQQSLELFGLIPIMHYFSMQFK